MNVDTHTLTHLVCRISTYTKSQNNVLMYALLQRYCGLHSHGFSETMKSGCFLCSIDDGGVRWGTTGINGGTFLAWERVREDFIFPFLFFFFMTYSHTSSAKNPGVLGNSRWCRAYQGKTWGTCNPEGDLERGKIKQESQLRVILCWVPECSMLWYSVGKHILFWTTGINHTVCWTNWVIFFPPDNSDIKVSWITGLQNRVKWERCQLNWSLGIVPTEHI